jgi:hypothetical protein
MLRFGMLKHLVHIVTIVAGEGTVCVAILIMWRYPSLNYAHNSQVLVLGVSSQRDPVGGLVGAVSPYVETSHLYKLRDNGFLPSSERSKVNCKTERIQSHFKRPMRAQWLVRRLDDRGVWVRFRAGAVDFSVFHVIQTDPGAHPASYPVGTGDSLGSKATGAWSSPLICT